MEPCLCEKCKGIYTVAYQPGRCEAVVQCQRCGRLWYTLLFERMGFGREDTLEEYRIPISEAEYQQIKAADPERLSLDFLRGRSARVFHESGRADVTSDFALGRCGR